MKRIQFLIAVGASMLAMAAQAQDMPLQNSDQNTDATSDAGRTHRPDAGVKGTELIGMTVKNPQGENLGNVKDLALDLQSGRIVQVIISSGGILGMGDELSAVPPTALRFSPDQNILQMDISKETLKNAPHFKADQWPDLGRPGSADGTYQVSRNSSNSSDGKSPDAENTRRNVRDRDGRTLTPFDQGNSEEDVNTTAQIRKQIVAANNLSLNAKNVKVITNKGRVTLRGPVNTAEEKRLIGDIATRIARSENVDNQLEVAQSGN